MIRILFLCHGNICRSPIGEFVMKDLAAKRGVSDEVEIASAATSCEELGNPIYPPAKRKLLEHEIGTTDNELGVRSKRARQITQDDYDNYDLIICMDRNNIRNAARIFGEDIEEKVHLLLEYAGRPNEEVADPWYTGDFDATWNDVLAGCTGLLKTIIMQGHEI